MIAKKTFINSECIHSNMSKKPRCPKCKTKYTGHRSGEYFIPLYSLYLHRGKEGREWIKIPYGYCSNCKKVYPI